MFTAHVSFRLTESFVAEVDVNLVDAEGGWTTYLSLDDAYGLDDVRDALSGPATSSGRLESPIALACSGAVLANQLGTGIRRRLPCNARGVER